MALSTSRRLTAASSSILPVYNIEPASDSLGRFAFNIYGVVTNIDPGVSGGDYAVKANIQNISQSLAVVATRLTLWGVPADAVHNAKRRDPTNPFATNVPSTAPRRPFMTGPTECAGH